MSPLAMEIFVTTSTEAAGGLAELAADWRADVVVHDRQGLGAPLAAALAGIPSAHTSLGVMAPASWVDDFATHAAPVWARYGVEPQPWAGLYRFLYLDYCPPTLQLAEIAEVTVAHPVRHPVLEWRPRWRGMGDVDGLPERPTVYVTLGTAFNARLGFFSLVLDGLADADVNVVVAIGADNDPAHLEPVPVNARVERVVSHHSVLPQASVVVCHGGSGTVFGALAHGVPLVLSPTGADQFSNTERCVAAGVGLRLPEQASAEHVRELVDEVLHDGPYRANARRVAEEIQAMPPLRAGASLVEQLMIEQRPMTRR